MVSEAEDGGTKPNCSFTFKRRARGGGRNQVVLSRMIGCNERGKGLLIFFSGLVHEQI